MTVCAHCKMDVAIRNPSGFCDHLHYPDNCKTCAKKDPDYLDEVMAEMFERKGLLNTFNSTRIPMHTAPDDPGMMGIDMEFGQLLMNFVLARKPQNIVELGTYRGYSTSWLILGTLLNGEGRVDAYECMPEGKYGPMWYDTFGLPKENFTYHEIPGGIWEHTRELPSSIDFVYHDTSHLLNPTKKEIELLLPMVKVGGVILFDDMCHPNFGPMQEYLCQVFFRRMLEEKSWRWEVVRIGHGLGIAERLK